MAAPVHQGEGDQQPAYTSPTQTYRPHNSTPQSPTPLPLHHSNFNGHPPRLPLPSPTTELPPISTAIYSPRESTASKYYDPTSDYGDRSLGRSTTRYDAVRAIACPISSSRDIVLFLDAGIGANAQHFRLETRTHIPTLAQPRAPTTRPTPQ